MLNFTDTHVVRTSSILQNKDKVMKRAFVNSKNIVVLSNLNHEGWLVCEDKLSKSILIGDFLREFGVPRANSETADAVSQFFN